MPSFRLNVPALREAAATLGDRRQIDISRRTGINKSVVSRLMNGRDLSLETLMLLSGAYEVAANQLAEEYDDGCEAAA
ncbi:helix-turn-helix domain-containing protein [Kitasatospora sp. NPDC001175]|uniref:helix-turn-helix domain-containing protein n=1 Tax=Kitasatospora sp. NPDC001175 TaxID=3157103 RepID=UPI003D073BA6